MQDEQSKSGSDTARLVFTPDRNKEPLREKADYPWFWCEEDPGTDPTGDDTSTGKYWNDTHLPLAKKLTTHEK